jgi:immune inhibitor A
MRLARILLGASLLLTVGAVLVALSATAVSATEAAPNVIKDITQPDGKVIKVRLWGDEFAHGWETLTGHTVAYDKTDKTWKYAKQAKSGRLVAGDQVVGKDKPKGSKHLRPSTAAINAERKAQGALAIGEFAAAPPAWAGSDTDVLFLYVAFSDVGCSFTPAQMQANMFGATASGPGNLADYYDEISYGALQLDGQVQGDATNTGCIILPNTHDFYDGAGGSADQMVTDAVAIADAYVDFTPYDNDGNGAVDALGLIYAGGGTHDGCATDDPPNGSGGDSLWPHSGGVGPLAVDGGARTVDRHIVNSELTYAITNPPPPFTDCNQIQTIGLFAHEFGHSLGLPDLYDTDVSSSGVGRWSTMASQYISTVNNADTQC